MKYFVYKLFCKDTRYKEVYVGSCEIVKRRMSCHKYSCHTSHDINYHLKVYQYMRITGGWSNWKYEILEEYECNNLFIRKREEFYINELNTKLNTRKHPGRTIKQYRIDNKEKIKQYHEQYRIDNKSRITSNIECECGCSMRRGKISRHIKTKKHNELMKLKNINILK